MQQDATVIRLPRSVAVRLRRPGLPAVAAFVGLVAIFVAAIVLTADAAAAPSFLVPGGRRQFPDWLAGPLAGLGEPTTWDGFGVLLLVLFGGYLLVLAGARAITPRTAIGAIVAAHVVFLLGPPLLSADVFGYVGFARLGALYHLSPYVDGTAAVPYDPTAPFIRWHNALSPYGPLFTLMSYAVVPLGVAGALWAFKCVTALASLGLIALVWRFCTRRGIDPVLPALFVGLNPALLVFEVGGGHNDALITLLGVGGLLLALDRRPSLGAAGALAAAGAKVSSAVLVPFVILASPDRRRALVASAIAAAVVVAAALVAFGGDARGMLDTIRQMQRQVALHSVPRAVSGALGYSTLTAPVRAASIAILVATVAWALTRAWRRIDPIGAAGWATLAVLCTTAWLLPWYITWLLPLAALSRDRRLHAATLAFTAYVLATRVTFLLA